MSFFDDIIKAAGNAVKEAQHATQSVNLSDVHSSSQLSQTAIHNSDIFHFAGSTINGTAGNDTLTGGFGNDTIFGGAGNDIIRGGLGQDVMTGGAGADTFNFKAGDSSMGHPDRVTDFNSKSDHIHFDGGPAGTDHNYTFISFMNPVQNDADAASRMQGVTDKAYTLVGGTGGQAWLFADTNGDHHFDTQVKLDGITDITKFDYHSIL